jgi:hypothetical protein
VSLGRTRSLDLQSGAVDNPAVPRVAPRNGLLAWVVVASFVAGGAIEFSAAHAAPDTVRQTRLTLKTSGGSIVPVGTLVPFTVTVTPAGVLVGHGGRARIELRAVRILPGSTNRDVLLKLRSGRVDRLYRCPRTPCTITLRSAAAATWELQAFLLVGKSPGATIRGASNRMRTIWHSGCRLAGVWGQITPGVGPSEWRIDASGRATESGLGGATGNATLNGRMLRIDWDIPSGVGGVRWSGVYQWTLDASGRCRGQGTLSFTAGPEAGRTHASEVRRLRD